MPRPGSTCPFCLGMVNFDCCGVSKFRKGKGRQAWKEANVSESRTIFAVVLLHCNLIVAVFDFTGGYFDLDLSV